MGWPFEADDVLHSCSIENTGFIAQYPGDSPNTRTLAHESSKYNDYEDILAEKVENTSSTTVTSPKKSQANFTAPKRIGNFGRSNSPKVDTAILPVTGDGGANSATRMVRQIWRSRSRIDLGKTQKLGRAELMTQYGGPPRPILVSPLQLGVGPVLQARPQLDENRDNENGGSAGDGLTMDLSVPAYESPEYNDYQDIYSASAALDGADYHDLPPGDPLYDYNSPFVMYV